MFVIRELKVTVQFERCFWLMEHICYFVMLTLNERTKRTLGGGGGRCTLFSNFKNNDNIISAKTKF